MLKAVLAGEANRAIHLMGDAGAKRPPPRPPRIFTVATARNVRSSSIPWREIADTAASADIVTAATLSREHRQVVLNRLELRDRPAELALVRSVSERLFQAALERAGHLPGAHGRTHPPQPFGMIHCPRRRVRGRGHSIDDDGIARFPGERRSRLQAARGAIDDRHAPARPSGVTVPEHHDDMPAGARERYSKRYPSKSIPFPCLAHGEPRLRSHTSIGSPATIRRTSNWRCECNSPWRGASASPCTGPCFATSIRCPRLSPAARSPVVLPPSRVGALHSRNSSASRL